MLSWALLTKDWLVSRVSVFYHRYRKTGKPKMRNIGVEVTERGLHVGILCGMSLEKALRIKGVFAAILGSDYEVQVKNYGSQSVVEDDETLQKVNDWLSTKSLPAIEKTEEILTPETFSE
jgi:hypothetical protein